MIAANFAGRDDIVIPKIYWEYTSRRVLVMEFLEGIKVTDIAGLQRIGIDPPAWPSSSRTSTASSSTCTGCSTPTRTPATCSCSAAPTATRGS